jgi:4-hydroxy 2-oxovalerate aldolase
MEWSLKLLDCTLRDGGYYNNWDFEESLVRKYIQSISKAAIDYAELGFRSNKNNRYVGPYLYTTDETLEALNLPETLGISVMVNASEIRLDGEFSSIIRGLFPRRKSDSPVDLVRLACHYHELDVARMSADFLKEAGYKIAINLMQVNDRSDSELKNFSSLFSIDQVDCLYVADSTGSMRPGDIERVVLSIKNDWRGDIGVHTHDNMGLALINTLHARRVGATWLDSTVTGMGRGPGNAKTEELILELSYSRGDSTKYMPLIDLVQEDFHPMKIKYGWGTNVFYYMAGKAGIHPTYVQHMLENQRYESQDIINLISKLSEIGAKSFDESVLEQARYFYCSAGTGAWSPRSIMAGKNILLIGGGASVLRHRNAIERYIKIHNPIVIQTNANSPVDKGLIDYYIASHPTRLMVDAHTYAERDCKLIAPISGMQPDVKMHFSGAKVLDYGLTLDPNKVEITDTGCVLSLPLVSTYAISVACSGGAAKINLVGFDGYIDRDIRNQEFERYLEKLRGFSGCPEIVSLTESLYSGLEVRSIYGYI